MKTTLQAVVAQSPAGDRASVVRACATLVLLLALGTASARAQSAPVQSAAPNPTAAAPSTVGAQVPVAAAPKSAAPVVSPAKVAAAQPAEVRAYCENIANAAADARFAWQTEKLADLELKIKVRVIELEAKTNELRDMIAKREDLDRKATEKLVGIYSKMKPETAAMQISSLDDPMAAAVLSQLTPGKASAIFNEIVPERAAKLAGLIAGASPSPEEKKL